MEKIKEIWNYILRVREKGKVTNKSGLYVGFTFISAYALLMSLVCFLRDDRIMGIVNAIIGIFMILTMILFTKIKSEKVLSWVVLSFLYVLMMFFMYEGGVGGVSIMWLLFIPMAGMALINLYYGALLSLLIGVSVVLYMVTPLHYMGYQYSEDYRIRFPIIYWAFLIMALFIFIRIDRFEEVQKDLIKKADEANRSKSDFLANMSHEIRTPMNAIMGLCEITLKEDITNTVRENSENIYRSGKSLMNIINELLDFSKIESGRMELQCNEYKLSDVLNDVIYMTVARLGTKKLEFFVDCDPELPDFLYGDEVRIRQIMINLLTNAVKYTKEGGFLLTLTGRRESYGINLIFSVRDTGIGIKKEHMREIFDAYGRVDTEKNRTVEGTGLGLPITKKLVKLMKGVILVKSEYNQGTEFRVVIPQKVMKESPIVKCNNANEIKILYYNEEERQEVLGQSLTGSFEAVLKKQKVLWQHCHNMDEVKKHISEDASCHIILGKKEYLENRDYFDGIAGSNCVAVIQGRTEPVAVGKGITSIYKPFYIKSVVDFVNKQITQEKVGEVVEMFTAPEAQILVVDDNSLNLKVIQGHLRQYQVQTDTAKSGMEAIDKIKQKRYDLIFMDHLMPEMDGIETYHQICLIEEEAITQTPIVALTANAMEDVKELFMKEGFQDFMSKPITSDRLKEVLKRWLREDLIVKKEV